jgi:hypothetical protein
MSALAAIIIGSVTVLVLAVFAACPLILSGRISRQEERAEKKNP